MAVFDKRETPTNAHNGTGTIVGGNVKLTGILKDSNDITIHGQVEGEIASDRNVTVSETAEIKGPISAQNVVIAGKVTGSIVAREKVELLATARVYGGLTMTDLIIRSGAIFIGKSTMPDGKDGKSISQKTQDEPIKISEEE